jgi:probable phosphoglycerate mutase
LPAQPASGKIILVRHGESEANRDQCFSVSEDVPLTDSGRRQAHELAERIARLFAPSRLFSSEFLRARQTAAIVGRTLGLDVEVLPGIHERDFGCLKGFPYERLRELIALDALYDPDKEWLWAPEDGESRDDVRRRVIPVFDAVRQRYPDEDALIVCHGVVMVAVQAHLSGTWKGVRVPGNCGVLIVEHDASGFGRHRIIEAGNEAESEASA